MRMCINRNVNFLPIVFQIIKNLYILPFFTAIWSAKYDNKTIKHTCISGTNEQQHSIHLGIESERFTVKCEICKSLQLLNGPKTVRFCKNF